MLKDSEKKAKGDELIIPLIALAFALYYIWEIRALAWEAQVNGLLIGGLIILLVALFVGKRAIEYAQGKISLRMGELFAFNEIQGKRIVLILLTVAYIFFMQWIGLTLSTLLFMIAVMALLGVRSLPLLLGLSTGLSALVYILFIYFLEARFPPGPIERLIERLF